MHYQRKRRSAEIEVGQVGRPREYDREQADPYGGAPKMTVRFEPEIRDWIKGQGGATWVRHVARQLKNLSNDPEFEDWWPRFELPDAE
jgi:hypothetical protein